MSLRVGDEGSLPLPPRLSPIAESFLTEDLDDKEKHRSIRIKNLKFDVQPVTQSNSAEFLIDGELLDIKKKHRRSTSLSSPLVPMLLHNLNSSFGIQSSPEASRVVSSSSAPAPTSYGFTLHIIFTGTNGAVITSADFNFSKDSTVREVLQVAYLMQLHQKLSFDVEDSATLYALYLPETDHPLADDTKFSSFVGNNEKQELIFKPKTRLLTVVCTKTFKVDYTTTIDKLLPQIERTFGFAEGTSNLHIESEESKGKLNVSFPMDLNKSLHDHELDPSKILRIQDKQHKLIAIGVSTSNPNVKSIVLSPKNIKKEMVKSPRRNLTSDKPSLNLLAASAPPASASTTPPLSQQPPQDGERSPTLRVSDPTAKTNEARKAASTGAVLSKSTGSNNLLGTYNYSYYDNFATGEIPPDWGKEEPPVVAPVATDKKAKRKSSTPNNAIFISSPQEFEKKTKKDKEKEKERKKKEKEKDKEKDKHGSTEEETSFSFNKTFDTPFIDEGMKKWKVKLQAHKQKEDDKEAKVFGAPLDRVIDRELSERNLPVSAVKPQWLNSPSAPGVPSIVLITCDWIRVNAYNKSGIFRLSGNHERIAQYKKLSNQGISLDFTNQDPNTVAGLLKLYLRELPDALLTYALYSRFVFAENLKDPLLRKYYLSSLLATIPRNNRNTLSYVLELAIYVANHSDENQMSPHNLAIVLGPCFLFPKFDDISNSAKMLQETASAIRITEWLIVSGYPSAFTASDILKTYRAESAYKATAPTEINIAPGDILHVFRREPGGLWCAESMQSGVVGWFPSSQVKLSDLPPGFKGNTVVTKKKR